MTTTPHRDIAALDVPADTVAAEAACITLRQAATATHSESDRLAYALDQRLVAHMDEEPTDATYPGWAEHIAALAASNKRHQEAS
ncbi:hypothetical protein [Streptomyces sp. BA2]|uniref:hypothetical protein n=1 Tax=Streptomyces sp. BA2 TaxID=436595 RepID=UPI001322EA0C|nr:hypothetical protein [Streptomyces sp. BA2]MWA08838.1 hypothetical protein [Streptomyces sp. BA2]